MNFLHFNMSLHLLIKNNIEAVSLFLLSWILSTVVNEIKPLGCQTCGIVLCIYSDNLTV